MRINGKYPSCITFLFYAQFIISNFGFFTIFILNLKKRKRKENKEKSKKLTKKT